MIKKFLAALCAVLVLDACASSAPRVVQATRDLEEIRLVPGMATQIEMPANERVHSVTVGNPALVTAERTADVVSLMANGAPGETNLIIRGSDSEGRTRVHQYRITVEAR